MDGAYSPFRVPQRWGRYLIYDLFSIHMQTAESEWVHKYGFISPNCFLHFPNKFLSTCDKVKVFQFHFIYIAQTLSYILVCWWHTVFTMCIFKSGWYLFLTNRNLHTCLIKPVVLSQERPFLRTQKNSYSPELGISQTEDPSPLLLPVSSFSP